MHLIIDFSIILFLVASLFFFFFFNDTATTEIYTLSLHDALPISIACSTLTGSSSPVQPNRRTSRPKWVSTVMPGMPRSEEHTSELQSRQYLVCRLLLEKKKKTQRITLNKQTSNTYECQVYYTTK